MCKASVSRVQTQKTHCGEIQSSYEVLGIGQPCQVYERPPAKPITTVLSGQQVRAMQGGWSGEGMGAARILKVPTPLPKPKDPQVVHSSLATCHGQV